MVSLPLVLSDDTCLNTTDIEKVFSIFRDDFILNKVVLNIDSVDYTVTVKESLTCACPHGGVDKPERFWHIVSKKEYDTSKQNNPCQNMREKQRVYCSARAKRIHWIKETIEGLFRKDEHIKYFSEDNGMLTHFLWDTKRFYIVLIKHLGKSDALLVTAYPVHKNKYRDYMSRLKKYEKK